MNPNFPVAPGRIAAVPENPFALPVRFEGLRRLAYNMYWAWHPSARDLFRRIDPHAWQMYRNPIRVLSGPVQWDALAEDIRFISEFDSVMERFDRYVDHTRDDTRTSWFSRLADDDKAPFVGPVAYFCAEFGLHESFNIYSGGLGILAGDHLKAASDLGLPFVGVGLFYRNGYFRQTIDADGHQEHSYPVLDPRHLPLKRVQDPATGRPLLLQVALPGRQVSVAVWLCEVGTVPLLLLDTDIAENAAADRPITSQLYVRGREMRLHQEIVLGVAGVRALRALGIEPSTWHLNEGHSALMLVERMREMTNNGKSFDQARDLVAQDSVFTIHTPVSAGNERFDVSLFRRLVAPLVDGSGTDFDQILELGRSDAGPNTFDMTAFSLRHTEAHNAVSHLHGETANKTWTGTSRKEILGLTNGVHMPSWLGRPMVDLLARSKINPDDLNAPYGGSRPLVDDASALDDESLWETHLKQKRALSIFVRGRLQRQLGRHGEGPDVLTEVADFFQPNVLTLGFARRFATYKRAALLFSDEDRLARLMWDSDRPVQILFAGKAHPADRPGQGVIQHIFEKSRSERFRGRVFILEDYDMRIGRFMTQGVDVWLNNPRRPLEASGTSGMKAAANGVPNCSILDGWWDEGYENDNGWAVGGREQAGSEEEQDAQDAQDLYRVLEEEVVPEYYERDGDLPRKWIGRMRRSIASSLWPFSTARMVEEYVERMYRPAAIRGQRAR